MYITRLASNEIFSPSNKIHREVGRTKDLSAPRYVFFLLIGTYMFPHCRHPQGAYTKISL